jgi:hypothetical protein
MRFRYTLLADGSSDRVLIRLIDWAILQTGLSATFQSQWADPAVITESGRSLPQKMRSALRQYPTDLLVVHRDSEREPFEDRLREIHEAVFEVEAPLNAVCAVVPVRMTEAWLLLDERAIRRAAGNPNGRMKLELPSLRDCESLPDPKGVLHELLRVASGLSGRRARRFHPGSAVHRVASEIEDFSPLRGLQAFAVFEQELGDALRTLNSRSSPKD